MLTVPVAQIDHSSHQFVVVVDTAVVELQIVHSSDPFVVVVDIGLEKVGIAAVEVHTVPAAQIVHSSDPFADKNLVEVDIAVVVKAVAVHSFHSSVHIVAEEQRIADPFAVADNLLKADIVPAVGADILEVAGILAVKADILAVKADTLVLVPDIPGFVHKV